MRVCTLPSPTFYANTHEFAHIAHTLRTRTRTRSHVQKSASQILSRIYFASFCECSNASDVRIVLGVHTQ